MTMVFPVQKRPELGQVPISAGGHASSIRLVLAAVLVVVVVVLVVVLVAAVVLLVLVLG